MSDANESAFFDFDEISDICVNHIENTGKPYTESEAIEIMKWINEVRISQTLLVLVLDGTIDIKFNDNSFGIANGPANMTFALSDKGREEMKNDPSLKPLLDKGGVFDFDD